MVFMTQASNINRYLSRHRVIAVVFQLAVGGAVFAFALSKFLELQRTAHHHSTFISQEIVIWLMIMLPATLYLNSHRSSRSLLVASAYILPVALAIPSLYGWQAFSSDSYWMQVPGDGLIMCWAVIFPIANIVQIVTAKRR